MATLSNPTLVIGKIHPLTRKCDVTVSGSVTFEVGDVGSRYLLAITLRGEDVGGDDGQPSDAPPRSDLLYTYQWPVKIFSVPHRVFTVTAAGTVNFSETRSLQAAALDEDESLTIKVPGHDPYPIAARDEVYAVVSLTQVPVTARTATATLTV